MFHPYLTYQDIDWDAALVAAMPDIIAAPDSASYAAAIHQMLGALGDDATRIVSAPPPQMPPTEEAGPISHWTEDSVLVLTLNPSTMGTSFPEIRQRMGQVRNDVLKAGKILVDTRSTTQFGWLDYYFNFVSMNDAFTDEPIKSPGMRIRMHKGYAPESGGTSGGYYSSYSVVDGDFFQPASTVKKEGIVFLTNDYGGLPVVALALEQAGKAKIVSEGPLKDAGMAIKHSMTLPYGIQTEVRLSEIVYENGMGGLAPGVTFSSGDPAIIDSCLEMLHSFKASPVPREVVPVVVSPPKPKTYAETEYPSLEYRLLAAFRMWSVIEYFFPYRDLMDHDWGEVLERYLPEFENAKSARDYHFAIAGMYSHIQDTHGFISSDILWEYKGRANSPLYIRWIEDKPVVAGFYNDEFEEKEQVELGDVVLRINGKDIQQRLDTLMHIESASTPQALMWRVALKLLAGPDGESVIVTLMNKEGDEYEVELPRSLSFGQGYTFRTGETYKLLNNKVGYADLDRLTNMEVVPMFEAFRDTDAIIFDMRGYPNGTAWSIAPFLADQPQKEAALFEGSLLLGPDTFNRQTYTFRQTIPPPAPYVWHYTGKTVMLIDERTISQAEHTGLFFEAANNTTFIGSHTNGANGDVTNFFVPGGVRLSLSGQGVRHIDGRQLQRVGLVPHVEVKPTLEGIRAGRDEVLEAAIGYVKNGAASIP